jgi:hypothetical protein
MEQLVLRHSKSSKIWQLAVLAFLVLGVSFSIAPLLGGAVAVIMACLSAARFDLLKSFVEKRVAVLVVSSPSLSLRKGTEEWVEIPWQAIEALWTERGRRGATMLCLRLTDPEKIHPGVLARFNRALNGYHLSLPISELELPPKEVASRIESAWRASS